MLQVSDPFDSLEYSDEEGYVGTSSGSARFPVKAALSTSHSDLQVTFNNAAASLVKASDPKALQVPKSISDIISAEMTSLLPGTGSLALNKKFSLSFEDTDFVLQTPKLDGWFAHLAKLRGLKKDLGTAEEVMTKTQLKILDIAPPLIHLYVRVCSFLSDNNNNSDNLLYAKNALEAILKQWGRAFAFMSHQRRRATVSLVQPDINTFSVTKGSLTRVKKLVIFFSLIYSSIRCIAARK